MSEINIGETVKRALEEAMRERGHANVLIAGRTGVGKSTLINSMFQGRFASTGQGRPVTDATREISKPGIPITIFDTRGLEMAEFANTLTQLKTFVAARCRDRDARQHIHVAWVCIAEDLRRVEEAETSLVDMLAEFVPVLGVVTKARADQGFRAEVQRLLPRAVNVVRVRSLAEELDDGHQLPSMGLNDLVQATADLIPEGQRRAFVAAQKVDLELKRKTSHMIVGGAAAAAAGVGGVPIPFADAALLIPIQVGMISGITATYGLALSNGFLSAVLASVAGGTITTLSGRAIVGGLLKLLPGLGSAAGGAIAATTAAALTTAFGAGYIAALDALFAKHKGEPPTEAEVLAALASLQRG
ncbi:GTPase [Sorangium sp. So ce321]|uniref:GTPase n=1 Tax=Sorangium sp. So ce321 TaxID=3133300 RepID=UPI003F60208B